MSIQETESSIKKELADVKDAIIQEVRDSAVNVKRSVAGVGGKLDAKADGLLGKVAGSDWSYLFILGYGLAAFLVGLLLGRA